MNTQQATAPESACADDIPELLDFLYGIFTANNPTHPRFEDLYPDLLAVDGDKPARHYVMRRDGKIVSSIGTYPMTMNVAGCKVSMHGLGQVATAPEMTGRGYMTQMLLAAIARMEQEGAAVSWLSGRHDRYARFGWEYVFSNFTYHVSEKIGRTVDDSLQVSSEKGSESTQLPELLAMQGDCSFISDHPANYAMRIRRQDSELWIAHTRDSSKPVAWAAIAPAAKRMLDFRGSVDGIMYIAKTAAVRFGGIDISVNPADRGLNERLRAQSTGVGMAGQMLLVVSIKKTIEQYAPYINARLPEGAGATLRMKLPDGSAEEVDVGKGGKVIEMDRKLMCRMLFGPERATEIPSVPPNMTWLNTVFPLPCFLSPLYHV